MKKSNNKYRLPKDFTEKWIELLESGEYRQGTEYLEKISDILTEDGDEQCEYCCLGLATKVLPKTPYAINDCNFIGEDDYDSIALREWVESGYPKELIYSRDYIESNTLSVSIPSILSKLNDGISLNNLNSFGDFTIPDTVLLRATSDNETINFTFKEIAQFIKDNFELYE